jgi:hypothetical protein
MQFLQLNNENSDNLKPLSPTKSDEGFYEKNNDGSFGIGHIFGM